MAQTSRQAAKGSTPAKGRRETKFERADRNLGELLQELRVAIPGVQILFAFLLTVPFAAGFQNLTGDQRDLYFGVLMATALSTALLIAPTAYHRLLFRMRDKEHLVTISNRLAIAGLMVLGVAITGAILLISDMLFDGAKTVIFTVAAGLTFVLLWIAMPLIRRAELKDSER